MVFKFVALSALLAVANAGFVPPITYATAPVVKYVNPAEDAVAATQQNVVRSFDGTVSSYSKAIDTPYSSVRKIDTRINNNVYSPAIAKTVTYAAPIIAKAVVNPTVYAHAGPAHAKVFSYSGAPTVAKTIVTPTVYAHPSPAVAQTVYGHETPAVHSLPVVTKTTFPAAYNHGPAATSYTHSTPGVAAYGTSQTVHYSPAEMVSHMSFDGFGTHWGF